MRRRHTVELAAVYAFAFWGIAYSYARGARRQTIPQDRLANLRIFMLFRFVGGASVAVALVSIATGLAGPSGGTVFAGLAALLANVAAYRYLLRPAFRDADRKIAEEQGAIPAPADLHRTDSPGPLTRSARRWIFPAIAVVLIAAQPHVSWIGKVTMVALLFAFGALGKLVIKFLFRNSDKRAT